MCYAENARLLQISSNERTTSRPVLCLVVASYEIHFEEGHEFYSSVALGGDPETEKKIRDQILTKFLNTFLRPRCHIPECQANYWDYFRRLQKDGCIKA